MRFNCVQCGIDCGQTMNVILDGGEVVFARLG